MDKNLKVPGFLDDHPSMTRILCPHCGCLHRHGRGPGHRASHCWKNILPQNEIVLVDLTVVPQEAIQIDREARKRVRILRDRQFANYRSRPKKPNLFYEIELYYLAATARELNQKILNGEPLTAISRLFKEVEIKQAPDGADTGGAYEPYKK